MAVVAIHDTDLLTLCPNALNPNVLVATPTGAVTVTTLSLADAGKALQVHVRYPRAGVQNLTVISEPRQRLVPLMLPVSEVRPPVIASGQPTIHAAQLDRLAADPDVKQRIEQQFRTFRKYVVVASPAEADFVFLAESRYVPYAISAGRVPERDEGQRVGDAGPGPDTSAIFSAADSHWAERQVSYGEDPGAVSVSPPILQPPGPGSGRIVINGSVVMTTARGGDRFAGWRESILALALPAAAYQGHEGNGAVLVAAGVWSGLAAAVPAGGSLKAASPEALVARFHDKDSGLPSYLPACAVTANGIRPAGESLNGVRDTFFRASTTLVSVPTTVTDREGRDRSALDSSAFHVYEDGLEQTLDRVEAGTVPTDIALLIDTSSGMRQVTDAIRRGVQMVVGGLRTADRVMVASFDSRIRVHSEFTTDRAETARAVGEIAFAGTTRLYDAIALTVVDRLNVGDRRKAIVLFTDGIDTGSQLTGVRGALAAIQAENISVYVVRYDTRNSSPSLDGVARGRSDLPRDTQNSSTAFTAANEFVQRLAEESGGKSYITTAEADVREVFSDIAKDLHSQYLLRYHPRNDKSDGSYRTITVTVDRPGTTVRARAGYRAGARQAER